MALQVVQQRKRGFICVNAHPEGCRRNVEQQIGRVRKLFPRAQGPKNVVVLGASTGYGLASRLSAAWGFGARTLGVFFERPPKEHATATAGWYNTAALHQAAQRDGLAAFSLNGDAFSDDIKRQAIEVIRRELKPVDLVIYSLAAPRRVDPHTGQAHDSVLKPVGEPFSSKTIDLKTEKVVPVTLPPADEKEVADTVSVMGGEDWRMWIEALHENKLLAEGAKTFAYSYIGPQVTWPIYRDGTIGRAKQHLERTAGDLHALLEGSLGGAARVSVNKAVVTQAAAAIPVVPLYLSILFRVMKAEGTDEGTVEQMIRLLRDFVAGGEGSMLDEAGRVRLDLAELDPEVQLRVARIWLQVTSDNLYELSDFAGFKRGFDNMFGFEVEGVDYQAPVETNLAW